MSKLTDKDILNDKVGQYNLTTQGQDTDGELETKVYKVRNEKLVSTCIACFRPSMNSKQVKLRFTMTSRSKKALCKNVLLLKLNLLFKNLF